MRTFLQGRIDLVHALIDSDLPVARQDLDLILTSVISACAAWRWPGRGFDRKRFVESLIRYGSSQHNLSYVSTGALLELGVISESESPWRGLAKQSRIFTGHEIDGSLVQMSAKYPGVSIRNLKKASYANRIYEWLRNGYAHTYWSAGNTTHVAPSRLPAQISYIGRLKESDGITRIASFHLDYLVAVAQDQVATLPAEALAPPGEWWIDQATL
jgi:hypothetical protein